MYGWDGGAWSGRERAEEETEAEVERQRRGKGLVGFRRLEGPFIPDPDELCPVDSTARVEQASARSVRCVCRLQRWAACSNVGFRFLAGTAPTQNH